MKKTLQFGSLALAIVMLASLCACNSRDEPQSSNELLTSAPTQVSAEEPITHHFICRMKKPVL